MSDLELNEELLQILAEDCPASGDTGQGLFAKSRLAENQHQVSMALSVLAREGKVVKSSGKRWVLGKKAEAKPEPYTEPATPTVAAPAVPATAPAKEPARKAQTQPVTKPANPNPMAKLVEDLARAAEWANKRLDLYLMEIGDPLLNCLIEAAHTADAAFEAAAAKAEQRTEETAQ